MIDTAIDFGLRLLWTQGIVRDLEAKLAERDARIEYLERELERERESGKGVREDGVDS